MVSISNAKALTFCDSVVDDIDGGSSTGILRIYDGTPPANLDTALSGNNLLAQLTFSDPAFGAAADSAPGGTATANAITADSSADATGTATFARAFSSNDGTTPLAAIMQLTVGTSGTEIVLNSASITSGANVSVTSLSVTMPEI